MNASSPSQRELARRLGLSVSAVSLALRNSPRISEETRREVQQLADAIGYQRPGTDKKGKLEQVSFITPYNLSNSFFADVLSGAEQECRSRQIALHFSQLERLTPAVLAHYRQADGLLVAGAVEAEALQAIQNLHLPTVLIENNLPAFGLDRVLVDNTGSLYRIVCQLVTWGHRRIGWLMQGGDNPSFNDRRAGYRAAMLEHGLKSVELTCERATVNSGEAALVAWLNSTNRVDITAWIACNDDVAIGVLHALNACGARVPDDVSVVGFDDLNIAQEVRPQLTTCRVARAYLGQLAVQRLLARVQDQNSPALALVTDTELIPRASTRIIRP